MIKKSPDLFILHFNHRKKDINMSDVSIIFNESMKSFLHENFSIQMLNYIHTCAQILAQYPIHPIHELIECLIALINAMKIAVFGRYVVINAKNCYNVLGDPCIIDQLNHCGIFVRVRILLNNKDPTRVYTCARLYSSPLLDNPFHITADALHILENEQTNNTQMNLFQEIEGNSYLLSEDQEDEFINLLNFNPENDPHWIDFIKV